MKLRWAMGAAISILSFSSFAAGGGQHDAQISDLIFPAINFVLLFGFILWKAKKPLSDSFTSHSEEVESLYLVAEEKDKEAQVKLDMFSKKMENIESERKRIMNDAVKDAKNFEKEHEEDMQNHIKRMEKETEKKLETEKNEMINDLNKALLERVISKTKKTVKENNDYKNKATQNLLSRID